MAFQLWSQDVFSKGELSPYMYARMTVNEYNNGLKNAQNVLTYPTGAAGKRFGTLYQATASSSITAFDTLFFQTFQYLNECTYLFLFRPFFLDIYLEGVQVVSLATTLDGTDVYNLDYTVLNNIFRITGQGFKPQDITRTNNAANPIVSAASNQFTLTNLMNVLVLPIQFTNVGGALPTTIPQIKVGVTYFMRLISGFVIQVYSTPQDAKANVNNYTIVNAGTGTNNVFLLNNWAINAVTYKNLPIYDFTGGYNAITFTPSAMTGAAVTLTASSAIFTADHVGGAYIGGGGTARITAFTDSTHVTIAIQVPFDAAAAISGALSFLAEPAWSDKRGWPQKCSSYQNRAIFANTTSLPNGFWASAINDYYDFNDLESDDDNAISWFPTSADINVIRFIVPYRSITVHTNSGIYSSPLSDVNAITPRTFSLQLQDSTPADVLQPRAIDNQIIILSGDDAHTMLWDGINNAYTSDIVSVPNEQVIRNPLDEAPFADLRRAGSRYVFIINENGSMAVFQTLLAQDVKGFTPQIMEQSYGNAYFRQVASNSDGRCWFLVERQIADAQAGINITAFTSSTLTAVASNFSTTTPIPITFTTTGTLPTSTTTTIAVQTYYWALGVTADTFKVYFTENDALANADAFVFTSAGTNSKVVSWTKKTIFTIEELTQDVYLDCAVAYSGSPVSTVTTGALFNGQSVKMVGDGYGFDAIGVNNQVSFEAHGAAVNVSNAFIGFPINTIMEPMPLSLATAANAKSAFLVRPKHIRFAQFMFNNTIGGTINGVPIALQPFDHVPIGVPPVPARGIFNMSIMKGWDDFNNPSFTIEHNEPFNIELLGVFYGVDV